LKFPATIKRYMRVNNPLCGSFSRNIRDIYINKFSTSY
jgi:hypothetical protein